jgi:hypothetical protein
MSILKQIFNFFMEQGKVSINNTETDIEVASYKVKQVLDTVTLRDLCLSLEGVETKDELKHALSRLNRIIRILLVAAPSIEHNTKIIEVLRKLKCSDKFLYHLKSASTVRQAVHNYKTEVAKDLVGKIRQTEVLVREDGAFDEKLISTFFPDTSLTISTVTLYDQKQSGEHHVMETDTPGRKKTLSSLTNREHSKNTSSTMTPLRSAKRPLEENTYQNKRRRFSEASPTRGHSKLEYERKHDVCDAFISGNCRRGYKCKFRHAN